MPVTPTGTKPDMSEEKSSSIGTMIVVAIAAGLIGYVIGKPAPPQVQAQPSDGRDKPAEPGKPSESDNVVKYPPVPHAVRHGSNWYALMADMVTWERALERCEKIGGKLVAVESEDEQDFIVQLAEEHGKPSKRLWIGATDKNHEGEYQWHDGRFLSETFSNWYKDWSIGKENAIAGPHESSDYVAINIECVDPARVNKWDLWPKEHKAAFVCEWE